MSTPLLVLAIWLLIGLLGWYMVVFRGQTAGTVGNHNSRDWANRSSRSQLPSRLAQSVFRC